MQKRIKNDKLTIGSKARLSYKHMSRNAKDNIQYYLMMIIPLIFIFIFSYLPMGGLVIAFQDYVPGKPFFGPEVDWVGLKWFEEFVDSFYFERIVRNTLAINVRCLVLGFFPPLIFAILVNEVRNIKFKKIAQTISYLPHFLSAVIVAGMVIDFIAEDGMITLVLRLFGLEARALSANAEAFPWIYMFTYIWKTFGWSSLIYLAAITGIDPGLYEAASLDGAGRLKKIWYITLPNMLPVITIQAILNIGMMFVVDSQMILLLYNPSTYKTADVIGTYVYRESLMGGKFSYGAASGLLMSAIAFAITWIANAISRKVSDFSMW